MTTHPIDEADARFLGSIGVVLVAATWVIGLVLISSLTISQNSMLTETVQPPAVVTGYMQPVFLSLDFPDFGKNTRNLSGARIGGEERLISTPLKNQ